MYFKANVPSLTLSNRALKKMKAIAIIYGTLLVFTFHFFLTYPNKKSESESYILQIVSFVRGRAEIQIRFLPN